MTYQEYHGVYGEDVEAALRFMFADVRNYGDFFHVSIITY